MKCSPFIIFPCMLNGTMSVQMPHSECKPVWNPIAIIIFMNLSSWGHANISSTAVLTEPMSGKMGISEKLWCPEFPLYTTYSGCVPLLIFNIFHSTQPYPDLYHCLNLDFWSAAILFEKENEKTLSFYQIVVEKSQYCQQNQQFPDHVSFRVPRSMCRSSIDRLSTNTSIHYQPVFWSSFHWCRPTYRPWPYH